MNRLIALAFLCPLALATPAAAQINFATPNGNVNADGHVIMCPKTGSSPVTYVPCDTTNPAAVTNTPTGTQAVNLTQILGAAPSLTNPLWVTPATGATFPVAGTAASGAALSGNPVRIGISDGTNAQNWLAAIALADGVNGNNTGAVAEWLWNGASYDRARGDTTAGMWTQIKAALPAGTAIIGKFGIDQTTAVTTNGVVIAPTATSGAGITPVVSASGESSHVLKGSAGNLYSVYATNLTATAGFLTVVNATSAPVDGAITPLECVPLPGNGSASITYNAGPPAVFSTGITAVITSATTCFTKTTGVITGFIKGAVQ